MDDIFNNIICRVRCAVITLHCLCVSPVFYSIYRVLRINRMKNKNIVRYLACASILALIFTILLAKPVRSETCIRFGDNAYEVCWQGDRVTSAVARGTNSDAKGYGGYFDDPHLVVVFARPQESSCSSSQTFFMELLGSDRVKLNRWVDKCGRSDAPGRIYERTR